MTGDIFGAYRVRAPRCAIARSLRSQTWRGDAASKSRRRQRAVAQDVPEAPIQFGQHFEALNGGAPVANFRDQHRTKIICTIGPSTESQEQLEMLAKHGMSIARLNMTHGDHEWHLSVIQRLRNLNAQGYNIAIMVDTEGSEAHLKARDPARVEAGDELIVSIRPPPTAERVVSHFQVSYEAFVDDVRVGDVVLVDGGMVILQVTAIEGPDVYTTVLEPGKVMSRATLTLRRGKELVQGKSAMLPVVTAKDWQDIDFAVENKVDFVAISFVRDRNVIDNVRSYIDSQLTRAHPDHSIGVVAKMEAYESIAAMSELVKASDAIMVARSDLGAQIPMEDVPAVQKEIVFRCRQVGKPVFVASQLLNSMIDVPVPTRAEVADCADAVRQQADALMLSGETAAGNHPVKAVQMLQQVFTEVEQWVSASKSGAMKLPQLASSEEDRISEEICGAAAHLAAHLKAKAIFVYTRTGRSARHVSRRRPDCPVVAITDNESVLRKLNACWGVVPILLPLEDHPELNVQQTFETVADLKILESKDLVVVVSDILSKGDVVRSVQLRHVL